MLSNLRIAPRLGVLIGVQIVILLIIGVFALNGLRSGSSSTEEVFNKGQGLVQLSNMANNIAALQETANRVNTGAMTWADGRSRLAEVTTKTDEDWKDLSKSAGLENKQLASSISGVDETFDELNRLFVDENTSYLSLFVLNDLAGLIDPFKLSLEQTIGQSQLASSQTFEGALETVDNYFWLSIILIIGGLILMGLMAYLIYRSIVNPMDKISKTVRKVADGDFETRSLLEGSDEIAELGNALDAMLDDKVQSLVKSEKENEKLNESVYTLLESVATLSDRDLTVNVPVSQDITGSVADAINLMVDEIVEVLLLVNKIADQVNHSSALINEQAISVNESVTTQKELSGATSLNLTNASKQLKAIAETARNCDTIAGKTSMATKATANTVSGTLSSMNDIRESIQETGKRIKGLGERSQEISSIVDIINTLSERTHVLALNASMQAAAAGEAGRGFAVVAEEVQRLAQSSRDATAQIAALVKNIQIDTNDTIATMDKTISTVITGTNMAETAGQQMKTNLLNTEHLVTAVNRIAQESQKQAVVSQTLVERAQDMMTSSDDTSQGMASQIQQTKEMVGFSEHLIQAVRVFKLPQPKTK
ncbi:MAG: HAMP domain-containing protein [Alcanivoracaceae bacterium]|nr:HAMP domain-containing protein [Alcanivoracaceae bacterium]